MKRPIEDMVAVLANSMGVDPSSLKERSRRREVVIKRQICCWILWHYGKDLYTLKSIAHALGYEDHTTVIHGRDTVDNFQWMLDEATSILKTIQE